MTLSTIDFGSESPDDYTLTHIFELPEETLPSNFYPLRLTLIDGKVQLFLNRIHFIFGRHSLADIQLNCPYVSRRHCEFHFDNGSWMVTDLGSLNGTLINDQMVHNQVLKTYDTFEIVGLRFEVELSTPTIMQAASDASKRRKQEAGISGSTINDTALRDQLLQRTMSGNENLLMAKKQDDEPCAFPFPKITNEFVPHSWQRVKEIISVSEENR